jgi:hypothetical protein
MIIAIPLNRRDVVIYSYVYRELSYANQGCDYGVHCFTPERSC